MARRVCGGGGVETGPVPGSRGRGWWSPAAGPGSVVPAGIGGRRFTSFPPSASLQLPEDRRLSQALDPPGNRSLAITFSFSGRAFHSDDSTPRSGPHSVSVTRLIRPVLLRFGADARGWG